jgi:hypothetical protein
MSIFVPGQEKVVQLRYSIIIFGMSCLSRTSTLETKQETSKAVHGSGMAIHNK